MNRKVAVAKQLRDGCIVAYRGVKAKGHHGFATDAGYYGAGLYYSTRRDIARWYANHDDSAVSERCVHFENPLVLGIRQAQRLALAYGTAEPREGGGVAPLRTWEAKDAADRLTATLRRRGHDGLVIMHTTGKRQSAGALELVDFNPPSGLSRAARRR